MSMCCLSLSLSLPRPFINENSTNFYRTSFRFFLDWMAKFAATIAAIAAKSIENRTGKCAKLKIYYSIASCERRKTRVDFAHSIVFKSFSIFEMIFSLFDKYAYVKTQSAIQTVRACALDTQSKTDWKPIFLAISTRSPWAVSSCKYYVFNPFWRRVNVFFADCGGLLSVFALYSCLSMEKTKNDDVFVSPSVAASLLVYFAWLQIFHQHLVYITQK